MNNREKLKDKQRIIVKVGTSSLIHKATGNINLFRLEKLVRVLTDLHNSGKDVILVSSGAIGVGFKALGLENRPTSLPMKQACSAVGQGQLMMIYQKLFAEYNQGSAQILITKETMLNDERRYNAKNTFEELLKLDPDRLERIINTESKEKVENTELTVLRNKLDNTQSKIDKLMDLYTIGTIPITEIGDRIKPLYEEKEKIELEINTRENELQEPHGLSISETRDILDQFADIDNLDHDLKRELVQSLIKRIEVLPEPDSIKIYWKFV